MKFTLFKPDSFLFDIADICIATSNQFNVIVDLSADKGHQIKKCSNVSWTRYKKMYTKQVHSHEDYCSDEEIEKRIELIKKHDLHFSSEINFDAVSIMTYIITGEIVMCDISSDNRNSKLIDYTGYAAMIATIVVNWGRIFPVITQFIVRYAAEFGIIGFGSLINTDSSADVYHKTAAELRAEKRVRQANMTADEKTADNLNERRRRQMESEQVKCGLLRQVFSLISEINLSKIHYLVNMFISSNNVRLLDVVEAENWGE